MEVVRSDGLDAMSLRDLTRAARVSPSAAYRHFPSRDHLVARVAQLSREALAHALIAARHAAPAKRDPKQRATERLRAIGHAYVTFAVENTNLFEAAFTRCDITPATPDEPAAWSILVTTIQEMIDVGAIPAERIADGPMIAWTGVHGLSAILTASIWPAGVSPDPLTAPVIDGIIRALS
jgi:AcrR family transcriptional regulator